jgi:aminoacrylate hydrolase
MPSSNFDKVPAEQKRLLQEFRANHPYSELDVDSTCWRYIACGQGEKTLLFLPGGFLKADMWFYPILALEKTYRILAPDSFTLQGTFAMDDVCGAIVQILEAEGVEKAIVVGISAGGGVAQCLVQEHPERVEHLVLSHCGVIEGGAEIENRLKRLLRLVQILPPSVIRWVLMKRTTGNIPPSSNWIEFHNAYFREAGSHTHKAMFVRFLQAGLEMRRSFVFKPEVIESWPGETLILSSKDDQATISSLEKLQARYPRARTHLFEEGGHHTFLFFPEAYTAALKAFLDEVGS